MRRKNLFSLVIFALSLAMLAGASFMMRTAQAVSDPPALAVWMRNTTGATGYNNIAANVQQVRYSDNYVYINSTGIPSYSIGPWAGNPNTASNQNYVLKIPRHPVQNTGARTSTPLGAIGVWKNGVVMFNALDAMSYQNQNIWHQNAVVVENPSFDSCLGHPQQTGAYHHHQNPRCLYTADATQHSPLLGYAYDGFPIYGPYGYKNADGTGGIKRVASSYRLRNITQRHTLADGTTLSASQYGPDVSNTYPLGYYAEDYEYVSGLGDLDQYNGRFTATPEYPNGTYAYFVTINADGSSAYPYIIGPQYYGVVATENITAHGQVTITESVTTYNPTVTSTPTPTPTPTPVVTTVQLSAAAYSANEGAGHLDVTVNRTGDTSTSVSVDYATSDTAGLTDCRTASGIASARCDYATSVGTLRFAGGETTKTISIPLVDDAYVEGTENFLMTLSNPSGAILGSITSATLSITDNDIAQGANPIDQTPFFVRQHYIDFLGREPDQTGYQGWQDILNNCPASGKDANGNYCDRIEVSADFFRSEEFQTRGYFIYRFYKLLPSVTDPNHPEFGHIPLYGEFMPDLARVSGFLSAQQLEDQKVAFITDFMARSEFQNKYGSLADPTAYVTALLTTLGLANHSNRNNWIAELNAGKTRAQVLREIIEDQQVYQKFYNEAFVIMQYFGYLRRDADASYVNWIQLMNSTNGDYRTMINGFLNSVEFYQRFGP
jgi:hypothetical protein